ncbi:NAD(+) diphosphatase [Saccharicrinis aurantiacus]|uniref:NAD(+) diphosphatase n=1 Tax=Saccharicrinis aurantiacus TaxID=1849719 RepID=UPI000837D398|nr:NAD(+) diphosphatase [Saccharicrinis aurantiacus]
MIQDIHPHLFSNTFVSKENIEANDNIFLFKDNALLLIQNATTVSLPRKKDIENCPSTGCFLFSLNEVHCYLVLDFIVKEENNFIYQEIRFPNVIAAPEIDWASIVALQLRNWYLQHKYCGKCGSETHAKTTERCIECSNCGNIIYPNIAPAVIVAILKGDKLLMAHNANFPEGFYSIIAGFVDVGETVEQCIQREAMEEVGIKVKNIRYYKSQPWSYSSSLMLGFIAEADDDAVLELDNKEIVAADWYSRDELPDHPNTRSIAGELIELFKKGAL